MKNSVLFFVLLSMFMIGNSFQASSMLRSLHSGNNSEYHGGELTISKVGKPIGMEIKARLLNAFKAQYGIKIKVESIELVSHRDAMWLVFQSGDRTTPTVALKLDEKKGAYVLNVATSVVNTCSGNPCSYCKFMENYGCYCNSGGESSACNHTTSNIADLDRFMAALEI